MGGRGNRKQSTEKDQLGKETQCRSEGDAVVDQAAE